MGSNPRLYWHPSLTLTLFVSKCSLVIPPENGNKMAANQNRNFSKNDPRYWESRVFFPKTKVKGKVYEAKIYSVRIQHSGQRRTLSTGESSKRAGGRKALEFYRYIKANGWEATEAHFFPKEAIRSVSAVTVGDYLACVEANSHLSQQTFKTYATKFRRLVAGVAGISDDKESAKQDYVNGGAEKWRAKIDRTLLSTITPEKTQSWKVSFIRRAGPDPRDLTKAKHTVNSILRNSKSLFSPKVLKFLNDIELPDPLPFDGVELEKEGSMRYHSSFDSKTLFHQAERELFNASVEQEKIVCGNEAIPTTDGSKAFMQRRSDLVAKKHQAFRIFLLALCAGLRRNEIDKLQWTQLDFDRNLILIQETDCFSPKADSSGQVYLDPEIMNLFRKFKKDSSSRFVIEGNEPRPSGYRATKHHKMLISWLREKGVDTQCPIHTLRKEFGSTVCSKAGIFVASRILRHSNISITEKHYLENQNQVTSGFGSLLGAANEEAER